MINHDRTKVQLSHAQVSREETSFLKPGQVDMFNRISSMVWWQCNVPDLGCKKPALEVCIISDGLKTYNCRIVTF